MNGFYYKPSVQNVFGYGPPPQPDDDPAQLYVSPAQPYGATAPYGAPPQTKPLNGFYYKPSVQNVFGYGPPPQPDDDPAQLYVSPAQPYGATAPDGAPPQTKPPKEGKPSSAPCGAPQAGGGYPTGPALYGNPFAALVSSTFPPGTDPSVVAYFEAADQDWSGVIDDKELQRALSSHNQSFSIRTIHLLMYLITNTNTRKIGPKEFTQIFYSLQSWRGIFEKFDRDRSGKIDINELRDALMSLGFAVSHVVLDLLVSEFDKSDGKNKAIQYDSFIECCLNVKGLTEKFKVMETASTGNATFTYETFMLTVLPFLIA